MPIDESDYKFRQERRSNRSMISRIANALMAGKKGAYYRKSFIWFLMAASIPGLITGLCMYWFTAQHIEREVSELHRKQIEERAQNIDDQFHALELDLSHWAFNPRFGYHLHSLDFVYHFRETWDVTTTLFMLQGSHPLIHQVQLYIDREQPVLFKPEYYALRDEAMVTDFEKLLSKSGNIYWTNWLPGKGSGRLLEQDTEAGSGQLTGAGSGNELLTIEAGTGESTAAGPSADPIVLVQKIPGGSSTPFGVIAANLKRDKVINLIRTLTPYNEGFTLLLDRDGRIIVSDGVSQGAPAMDRKLRDEVTLRGDRSGTFLFTEDGITYSVSYGAMNRISSEWTYVSAAPLTAVTAPVVTASNFILGISASGLLLALLLSWLQWSKLTSESVTLREKLEEHRASVRESFLLQLLQGHLHGYTEEDLRERLKLYGWNAEGCHFYIMHIRMTGQVVFTERFTHGDESLVTFAASNIVEELAAERFEQFSVINFHDLTVGLLAMARADETAQGDSLERLSEEVTKAVNHILKMQVTITIGGNINAMRRVPELFMEVERATGYRKFVNQNQLIRLEQLQVEAEDEVRYPFVCERELVHAMRDGNREETERLVTLFMEEAQDGIGTEHHVKQCMLQLFGTIQHLMLQSGTNPQLLFEGENMFERLSHIREPDDMLRWMKERVILPFLEEREARANTQLQRMVEKTIDYIRLNYSRDMSLEECADHVGTNPYTLSKLFKQVTGVNFIDYITELRIEKAKQLLCETDLKVLAVASEVGYEQRYFNRIFKKQVGVTPGQFREQYGA